MIGKMLAKAEELEHKAAALRLAAAVFDGNLHEQKRATAAQTMAQAIKVRRAQQHARRNGGAPHDEPEPRAPRLSKWKQTAARREKKRDVVLAIVERYGKPMPLGELKAAARAQGIRSLTGMVSYVRAGFLQRTTRRGQTYYAFRQRPA